MKTWIIYSLGAFFCWGVWSFFCKLASLKGMNWKGIYVYGGFFYILLTGYFILSSRFQIPGTISAKAIAVLAGLFGTAALLCFYKAITIGKLSIVLPMSSLYPALSIFLAVLFLKEKLSNYNIAGIILALISIILLTHD
jgi:transporter family protein